MTPRDETGAGTSRLKTQAGKVVHGVAGAFAAKLFGRMALFVAFVLFARALPADAFGYLTVGWGVAVLGGVVGAVGLDMAVFRFGPTNGGARVVGRKAVGLAFATATLLAILIVLLSLWLGHKGEPRTLSEVLIAAAVMLPLCAGGKVMAATLRAEHRAGDAGLIEDVLPPAVALAGAIVLMAVGDLGLEAALLLLIGGFLLASLTAFQRLGWFRRQAPVPAPAMRTLLRYGLAAIFAMVGSFALAWVDKFVLAWLSGPRSVGVYQTAAQLSAAAPVLVLGALAAVVLPVAARSMAAGDDTHRRAIMIASTKWAFFLVLPFVAVLMAAPGDFITSFYGARYEQAAPVLRVLALGQLANGATGLCGALLTLWGGERLWAAMSLGAILVTVAADLFAIPRWGVMGAAGVTAGINWLFYGAGITLLAKRSGGFPYGAQFLIGPMAALVPALAAWAFSVLRPASHLHAEWILVVAAASGACYLGIVGALARGRHDALFWNWLVGTVREEPRP